MGTSPPKPGLGDFGTRRCSHTPNYWASPPNGLGGTRRLCSAAEIKGPDLGWGRLTWGLAPMEGDL